ncbi:hypothetical protein CANCADRAFT_125602 [Tortispora caseinolytica NRRL Y-17796]|uniref:Uncharacterized protein n=1 Tax=Tortispora caseinolytica NRRL Y-17796 TaxID=767744 RepID=A0A1E4TA48_9ASCO|nr:hypothetical protein CANCADRAFT_125602 [Tortispora caseinolytica NRRL Y-17796]
MRMYALGSNSCGKLGIGTEEDSNQPVLVQGLPEGVIQLVASGGNHTVVLINGVLYGCGADDCGQLGGMGNCVVFRRVPFDIADQIVYVSCGWEDTLVSCKSGKVYISTNIGFECVGKVDSIKKTASCMKHHLILSHCSRLYHYGNGKVIGSNSEKSSVTEIAQHIVDIAAGRSFYVTIGKNGVLEISQHGRVPKEVMNVPSIGDVSHLQATWSAVFVESNNKIVSWGKNVLDQLFPNDESVEQFSVGSSHGLCIINNQCYAWGWNEHGNCGNNEKQTNGLHLISVSNPKAVFAGAAASFILAD